MLNATASDHRIKAAATVSAVDIARQFRNGADGTQDPAVFGHMLDAAAAARTAEAHGESPQTFQLFPDTAEQARSRGGQHGLEGFEYYISGPTRHPRSAKFLTWSSIDHLAFFDAFRFVNLIGPRPLLMIVGREAVTAWMSIQAFQNATGPRELHWVDGASHNDLYYKSPVRRAGRHQAHRLLHQEPCRRPGTSRGGVRVRRRPGVLTDLSCLPAWLRERRCRPPGRWARSTG